ncbi:MAG: dihydroorotate dehydrogenase [Pseudomonadota bacterium]
MTDRQEKRLEDLFETARRASPMLSASLTARILADAKAIQETEIRSTEARKTPKHRSFRQQMIAVLWGWPGVTGLASAAAAGLWIGVSQPAAIEAFADVYFYGVEGEGGLEMGLAFEILFAEETS